MSSQEGRLDAELVFVSKYFHVDYEEVEKNLRKVLEATLKRFTGKIVVVYGDLCLGQNGEMKKLTDEYGVAKVDAANCVDCQLGGGGKFFEADPEHNLMFMGPGMIEFFKGMKEKMLQAGSRRSGFCRHVQWNQRHRAFRYMRQRRKMPRRARSFRLGSSYS